jgi:hypothetical protein
MALVIDKSWRDDVKVALDEISSIQREYPGDTALISASCQLTYLLALIDGIEKNDAGLEDVTLGYVAMYQLSDIISPKLAEMLSEINGRIRRRLRQDGRKQRSLA